VEWKCPLGSNMPYLKAIDVDDELVDELWEKVSSSGSFYSIGDGVTKERFRWVLFQSALVLRGPCIVVRLDVGEYVEYHPMIFGHSIFRYGREVLEDIARFRDRLFPNKPICCIIPDRMRGTKHLAISGGMVETGRFVRGLSGVAIPCTVFTWRETK
jgi:hypothetical protein